MRSSSHVHRPSPAFPSLSPLEASAIFLPWPYMDAIRHRSRSLKLSLPLSPTGDGGGLQLTYDPSDGPLCSAGRQIAPISWPCSRPLFAHRHEYLVNLLALFLRAPSTRTTPAPTSRRFFYAHHRRAPRPLLPAGVFSTRTIDAHHARSYQPALFLLAHNSAH